MNAKPGPRRRVTLHEVRARGAELAKLGEPYGVHNIRVFGSVARGESNDASDLDLLVELLPGRGLLALSGFAIDVEDALQVYTEVATVEGLKPRIRARVAAEAVPV